MATKKKKKDDTKTKPSASHIMLYIVLIVYIVVAVAGIAFVGLCVANGCYDAGASGLITVGSIIGACSCTVVGFYSTKAAKENEIKEIAKADLICCYIATTIVSVHSNVFKNITH